MRSTKFRNTVITIFVILWTFVFHYESLRYFYLNKLFQKPLPKVKFLFPPAGWIMFYRVGDVFGTNEVYGVKGKAIRRIDPHDILRTRTIGFDNIHRGIMNGATHQGNKREFCGFLNRKFPYFDQFLVVQYYWPSITKEPYKQYEQVLYKCVK